MVYDCPFYQLLVEFLEFLQAYHKITTSNVYFAIFLNIYPYSYPINGLTGLLFTMNMEKHPKKRNPTIETIGKTNNCRKVLKQIVRAVCAVVVVSSSNIKIIWLNAEIDSLLNLQMLLILKLGWRKYLGPQTGTSHYCVQIDKGLSKCWVLGGLSLT